MFGNGEWRSIPNSTLNLGGMVEFYDTHNPLFSPRLGFNYQLNDFYTIKLGYSRAYRVPTLYEANADILVYTTDDLIETLRQITTLDDLEPEKIDVYEISLTGNYPKYGLSFDARLFYEEIDNMIAWVQDYTIENPIPQPQWQQIGLRFLNDGSVSMSGIEIGVKFRPTSKSLINMSYSYINADGSQLYRILSPEQEPTDTYRTLNNRVPEQMFSILGSYRFDNGLKISSAYYYSDKMTWAGVGDFVPRSHRWDIKLAKNFRFSGGSGDVSLIFQNIDGEYIDFYNTPQEELVNIWTDRIFLETRIQFH